LPIRNAWSNIIDGETGEVLLQDTGEVKSNNGNKGLGYFLRRLIKNKRK